MKILIEQVKRDFEPQVWNAGMEYVRMKRAKIKRITQLKNASVLGMSYRVVGEARDVDAKKHTVTFVMNEEGIQHIACDCQRYLKMSCSHMAAVVIAFSQYASQHSLRVVTRGSIVRMIDEYIDANEEEYEIQPHYWQLELEPKLEQWEDEFRLSFRVGDEHKYVIKNVFEFVWRMEQNEKYRYGAKLEFVHQVSSFTTDSVPILHYLIKTVHKYQELENRLNRYGGTFERRGIVLDPYMLDELFNLLEHRSLLYEDKRMASVGKKKKGIYFLKRKNPRLILTVEPEMVGQEFDGIRIYYPEVVLLNGGEHCYLIVENYIYQADGKYKQAMLPFLRVLETYQGAPIAVKPDMIGPFYSQVMNRIRDYVDMEENDSQTIAKNLPPEPVFSFYLDRFEEDDAMCRIEIQYEDKTFHPHDREDGDDEIRDFVKEYEVVRAVRSYMGCYNDENRSYYCGNEENLFDFLENGISVLMKYGTVHVSNEFELINIHKNPRVSVGISIASNLLELNVSADEIDFEELSEILQSYRKRKKYHRLRDGGFFMLEDSPFESIAKLVEGMQLSASELTSGKIGLPSYRALYMDTVLKESEGLEYQRDASFRKLIRNFRSVGDGEYEIPITLGQVLRPYQKEGYRWIRMLDEYGFGGILADDMGLGKTLEVIAVLLAITQEEENNKKMLVVCPASLVYNWESEFSKFAPGLQVCVVAGSKDERKRMLQNPDGMNIFITSYDLLKRDVDEYSEFMFRIAVIDEAQYIKNHDTRGARAVKMIQAKTRLALTGTPIENRLSELWSIFDYLMPGFLYSYESFRKTIEIPITKHSDETMIHRLKTMVAPFIMRRLKKDVQKDLPDKIEQTTYTRFEEEQQTLYDAYVISLKKFLDTQSNQEFSKNRFRILAELMRLRQICCDPSLCFENYDGGSAKLETCMELIHNAIGGGHKMLIFSQFTSMLEIIAEKLREDGIAYYEITGKTPKEKRIQLVNHFNEDETPVFLISLKAGGTGLNLTGADIVIHYDPWWNAAAQNQATDRAHRIGQKKTVTVFKLIAKKTIEEKILEMQQQKSMLADQIISGDANLLHQMTKEDLLGLL